jgi:hypothetical protein
VSDRLHDLAEILLGCVCEHMDTLEDHACPCVTYVAPAAPALDREACCGCTTESGLLTVHLGNVYPSDSFPVAAARIDLCRAPFWVAEYAITVARCVPTLDSRGRMPNTDNLAETAAKLSRDRYAVLQALACCLPTRDVARKRKRQVSLAGYRSLGESGGCVGFEQRALVEVDGFCVCPEDES